MRKQDIAKILLVLCAMMPVASMSFAGDKPLSPDDVPSECNKKNGSVIDVSTLRKRIAATPKKTSTWIDSTYGFQFVYPSGLRPSHQFEATYLQPGNWSYFSTKDNGRRLVSIKLPTTPQKTTVARYPDRRQYRSRRGFAMPGAACQCRSKKPENVQKQRHCLYLFHGKRRCHEQKHRCRGVSYRSSKPVLFSRIDGQCHRSFRSEPAGQGCHETRTGHEKAQCPVAPDGFQVAAVIPF